jgi:hypothetical protein
MKAIPCENCQIAISYSDVCYSLHRTGQTGFNQNRKRSGRPRCTTEQEEKYIRVSSLRNIHLTSPQLAVSLNSTRKTPVSQPTVKMRLRDAGLLGRVAKKKPYLGLANLKKSVISDNVASQTILPNIINGWTRLLLGAMVALSLKI